MLPTQERASRHCKVSEARLKTGMHDADRQGAAEDGNAQR